MAGCVGKLTVIDCLRGPDKNLPGPLNQTVFHVVVISARCFYQGVDRTKNAGIEVETLIAAAGTVLKRYLQRQQTLVPEPEHRASYAKAVQ